MASTQRVSRVLLGLIAGLGVGLVVGWTRSAWALQALQVIAPLGTLWINAVRMTVIPLVVALLFTSIVASDRDRAIGRETAIVFATFVGVLLMAAVLAWLLAPRLVADIHFTPETAAALRASVTSVAGNTREQIDHLPGFRDWLTTLIPANAMRAAADGAMLPLIVFTVLFGVGARQIAPERRAALTSLFAGIAEAMTLVVEWTMLAAPIGVFALVAAPAAGGGASMAGAIGFYVIVISLLLLLFTLLLYPIAHIGGLPIAAFSRGVLPAQVVALASGSSLASLPAMMSGASSLRISRRASGFVLPLAVGTFKAAAPVTWTVGALFVAKMYGVTVAPGAVLGIALMAVGASFCIPGVPQGSLLLMSAVLPHIGVPAEGVALLIAVDTIPDLFGTMANVTGDMVATVVVARTAESAVEEAEAVDDVGDMESVEPVDQPEDSEQAENGAHQS